jgi:hypothetical protein
MITFNNHPDKDKPLPKEKRHVIAQLSCHEETIGDNIRRGEIVAALPPKNVPELTRDTPDRQDAPAAPQPLVTGDSTRYFWHPIAVCCTEGFISIDGVRKDVREFTLNEFVSLPGALFSLWSKELVETNPELFTKEAVTEKKSTNS